MLHNIPNHTFLFQMLSYRLLAGIKHLRGAFCARNIGIMAPSMQKCSDTIQQLFVDKIKEYKTKSGGGNKLVEPSPDIQAEMTRELEKLSKVYGGTGKEDMTQFPSFKWSEPVVDPINQQAAK